MEVRLFYMMKKWSKFENFHIFSSASKNDQHMFKLRLGAVWVFFHRSSLMLKSNFDLQKNEKMFNFFKSQTLSIKLKL